MDGGEGLLKGSAFSRKIFEPAGPRGRDARLQSFLGHSGAEVGEGIFGTCVGGKGGLSDERVVVDDWDGGVVLW